MSRSGNAALGLVLAMLAAWLVPGAGLALETEQALRPGASVFQIRAVDAQGRIATGSAVLVAARTLVTNCHVVLNAREIAVIDSLKRHPVHVTRTDIERDLCLLDGPALDAPLATRGDTRWLRPGETIRAAGYSTDGPLTWGTGRIEGLFSYSGGGRVIQGSAPFDAGASGGGLFDESGRLIGILTFKARAGGPFHFAVPVEWIADLMAHQVSAPRRDGFGVPFWQYAGSRQPVFLRAASLAAQGKCAELVAVAGEWLQQEPENPEAGLTARNAERCRAHAARDGG